MFAEMHCEVFVIIRDPLLVWLARKRGLQLRCRQKKVIEAPMYMGKTLFFARADGHSPARKS